jgi:hypothetical protein
MTVTVNVTFRYRRLWLAKLWIRVMQIVSLAGRHRAEGWALAGVDRIVQIEVIAPRFMAGPPRSIRDIRSRA